MSIANDIVDEPRRRLTISDVCILLASIGAGLSIARYYRIQYAIILSNDGGWLTWLVAIGGGIALPLSAAVLILRMRRPRPSWRKIGCQPGVIACVVILSKAAIETVLYIPKWSTMTNPAGVNWWNWLATIVFPGGYVPMIVGSWATLLLTGRYQADPGAIDRLGRFLGWSCIAIYLVAWTTRFF